MLLFLGATGATGAVGLSLGDAGGVMAGGVKTGAVGAVAGGVGPAAAGVGVVDMVPLGTNVAPGTALYIGPLDIVPSQPQADE